MSDQFLRGQEFALGDQVTAQKLMDLVNKATLQVGSVTSQAAITTKTVAADDQIVAYDASADALVKVKAEDILQSNLPVAAVSVATNVVNGVNGADTVITPAAGQKVSIAGNVSVTGTFTPTSINPTTESFGFTGPKALTIPSGNTAARPSTPVSGDLRFNTQTNTVEVYKGSAWGNPATSSQITVCYDEVSELKANIIATRVINGASPQGNTTYANFNLPKINGGADVRYTETFTVPAGEKWVIDFSFYVFSSSTDDRWGMGWVYDSTLEQFHQSDQLLGNTFSDNDLSYIKIIDNTLGTSSLTKTIEFKSAPLTGTGGDTHRYGDFKGWTTPSLPLTDDAWCNLCKWNRRIRKYKNI